MGGSPYKQVVADLALLFVAFIWGVTFVIVKDALADIGPYYFLAMRFAIAFLFMALVWRYAFRHLNRASLAPGLLIGVALFGGYAFQTVALQYTSAANTGFITGLSVVLVPVFAAFLTRRLPTVAAVVGVVSAAAGLAMLAVKGDFSLNYGDTLAFLCAVCYAAHIIMVGRYAPRFDPILLAIIQVGTVGLISGFIAPVVEIFPTEITRTVQIALLATAIPATSLAFLIQNWAQRFTSPTHTAVILTMEPVFAGLTAWLIGGEYLGVRQLLGGALIVAGMLITVLKTTGSAPDVGDTADPVEGALCTGGCDPGK